MKIKKYVIILLVILCFSCTKKETVNEEPKTENKNSLTIGLSIDTLAIERWVRDCDVFLNTAKEQNAHVIVQNAGNDLEEQIKQIKYLIDKEVDVLVILAKKADSFSEIVQRARTKGIPVIAYDRLMTNTNISLYMTIDSQKVGEYMATVLSEIKPYGNYFCFYGPHEDFNMELASRGVQSVLKDKPITITETYYTDGWNYDLSYTKMSELLDEGKIPDAVICGNDAVAGSVIRALSEHQLGGKIPVSGQDADISACQYIIQGKQTVTIYKPITELARLTAIYACELGKGKNVTQLPNVTSTIDNGYGQIPVIWLQPEIVVKDNIDEIVIDSGFHTYGEVYRNVNE